MGCMSFIVKYAPKNEKARKEIPFLLIFNLSLLPSFVNACGAYEMFLFLFFFLFFCRNGNISINLPHTCYMLRKNSLFIFI